MDFPYSQHRQLRCVFQCQSEPLPLKLGKCLVILVRTLRLLVITGSSIRHKYYGLKFIHLQSRPFFFSCSTETQSDPPFGRSQRGEGGGSTECAQECTLKPEFHFSCSMCVLICKIGLLFTYNKSWQF